MSIFLICVTANGGLPIFTRMKGNCESLPFSTVASLNGLHMFFKSLGVSLYTTYAGNWTYVWKDFFNTITIIVCSSDISNNTTEILPDFVFGAFSLFISRDELLLPYFLDRLKKESKNYMHLLDAILELSLSQLLGFSSCLISTENAQMLQCLNDEFSIQCGSLFCCLVVGHKLAVATEGWWDLDILDRQLLLLYFLNSTALQNDVVLYLPKKSPNVAYRFITLPVSPNSVLCVISGTEPSLRILHDIAENTFRGESNLLFSMESSITRCLPKYIELDSSVVGIIIANSNTRKCILASNIHHSTSTKRYLGDCQNMDLLRRIFDDSFVKISFLKSNFSQFCELSCQFCSLDTHKCMTIIDSNDNIVSFLFLSSLPAHTIKYIARQSFSQIIQEKSICW